MDQTLRPIVVLSDARFVCLDRMLPSSVHPLLRLLGQTSRPIGVPPDAQTLPLQPSSPFFSLCPLHRCGWQSNLASDTLPPGVRLPLSLMLSLTRFLCSSAVAAPETFPIQCSILSPSDPSIARPPIHFTVSSRPDEPGQLFMDFSS